MMFFFNTILEIFGGSFESKGQDTIHDYLHGAYGRNLFLLHDLSTAESGRTFILYFLKKIKDEKMSLSSTIKEPVLWCLDEADKLADGGRAAILVCSKQLRLDASTGYRFYSQLRVSKTCTV